MAYSETAGLVVACTYLITPVLGLVWLGIRNERLQQRRMLRDSIKMLHRTAVTRNRRW